MPEAYRCPAQEMYGKNGVSTFNKTVVVKGTGVEFLFLQTTEGTRVFHIFINPQLLSGNGVGTIGST